MRLKKKKGEVNNWPIGFGESTYSAPDGVKRDAGGRFVKGWSNPVGGPGTYSLVELRKVLVGKLLEGKGNNGNGSATVERAIDILMNEKPEAVLALAAKLVPKDVNLNEINKKAPIVINSLMFKSNDNENQSQYPPVNVQGIIDENRQSHPQNRDNKISNLNNTTQANDL